MTDLSSFIRPDIARMAAYTPVKPFEALSREMGRDPADIIKLDANENPYGPAPAGVPARPKRAWGSACAAPAKQCARVGCFS
jgi:histidinol-phosphate aminotransferase